MLHIAAVGACELIILRLSDLVPFEARPRIARLPSVRANHLTFAIMDSLLAHIGNVLIAKGNGIIVEWNLNTTIRLDTTHNKL